MDFLWNCGIFYERVEFFMKLWIFLWNSAVDFFMKLEFFMKRSFICCQKCQADVNSSVVPSRSLVGRASAWPPLLATSERFSERERAPSGPIKICSFWTSISWSAILFGIFQQWHFSTIFFGYFAKSHSAVYKESFFVNTAVLKISRQEKSRQIW